MSYDPRRFGARCDECPLRDHKPVPPELRRSAEALLVGEAPGSHEVEKGAPFVGPSGFELQRALATVGKKRASFSITNALLCQPKENRLDKVIHEVKKANKQRLKEGLAPLPTPIECCRPRLLAEIKASAGFSGGIAKIVPLGGTALLATTGKQGSILELRGGPREVVLDDGTPARVLPTLHPAFVLRAKRWMRAFHADVGRAVRWFSSGLRWKDPRITYVPSPAQIRAFLSVHKRVVFDVETAPAFLEEGHYEPMLDRLRCIGLSDFEGTTALVIPFASVTEPAPPPPVRSSSFYNAADVREVIALLREFLSSTRWLKGGWNEGYYDLMVVEASFEVPLVHFVDGIGLHKMVEPELPHRLGYAGSVYTDAPSWKEDHTAKTAETDKDLWLYNARDCAITGLAIQSLVPAVKARGQERAARFWPFVQSVCVGLHRAGMPVDQERRRWWDAKLLKEARAELKTIHDALGRTDFNPGSTEQLRDLFFEKWRLLPHDYTDLGDPSTGDDSLRAFLSSQYHLTPEQRTLVRAVRMYRRKVKERGTYVTKLRPINEPIVAADLAWDDEETLEEREQRLKKLRGRPGIVLPDGRVHPDYNAHGTIGWRLSSSNPNAQNFPDALRDMVTAGPGFAFVGCDQAQLELRMVAGLSRAAVYLAALNAKEDPHKLLCLDFFGDEFTRAEKDQKKALRRFVKEFTYASLYRAGDETKHEVLTSSEDKATGRLLYSNLTLREVAIFSRKFLDRNPEIEAWWEADLEEFRRQGWLAEPIFGLRRDFLDGEEESVNEIANLKAQSGGAALVHIAEQRFLDRYPFDHWGPCTSLINNGHDALVARVPAEHPGPQVVITDERGKITETKWCKDPNCGCTPSRVAKFLEECMTIDGRPYGLPVTFEGESKIGNNWKEV